MSLEINRPTRARRRTLVAATALAGLLGIAPMLAKASITVGGATFADTYPVAGQTLKLNGAGLRIFFHIVNGYATALYMTTPEHSEQAIIDAPNPKVIYTEYLHDAPASQVRTEYSQIHDSYCANNPCEGTDEASYREFIKHIDPVKTGGNQAIVITDQGITVFRNNAQVFAIPNPSFGKDLIRSLVGPASPTDAYRKGIIGQ